MKPTAGSGKRSGFAWGGEAIVFYSLPYQLPYTAQMLERREKRLADVAQSDKTIYTTDTKVGGGWTQLGHITGRTVVSADGVVGSDEFHF